MPIVTGYKVQKRIKDGGFSNVYRGIRVSDGRPVALKIVSDSGMRDKVMYRLFKHEIKVLKDLEHPYIVEMLEYVSDSVSTRPTIVLDYFESENLKARVMQGSPVIKRHLINIFTTLCEALQYLHQAQIVHKDIKPENILVNESGETRLIDFSLAAIQRGFSRFLGGSRKVQGTPLYMSPEQIRNESLDIRSDIYSLGCSMYEVLTGKPPFMAASQNDLLRKHCRETPVPPQRKDDQIPDDINDIVLQMLAKKQEQRPQTPDEILEILSTYET